MYKNLNHDGPHRFWCLQEPLMMCSLYKNQLVSYGGEWEGRGMGERGEKRERGEGRENEGEDALGDGREREEG